MHDLLFAKQDSLGKKPWTQYAADAGVVDLTTFNRCMADTAALKVIRRDVEAGTRLGKPRIFVAHGTRDGVHPFAGTRDALVPKLRREGYAVTFRAFVGGHVVPAPVSRAAVSWFLG